MPTVEFLTRGGCRLCDEAEGWLRRWAGRIGLDVDKLDVDADAALTEEFGGVVPVLRTREGLVVAEGRWPRYRTLVALTSYRLSAARPDSGPPDDH